mmetsp:Transcript_6607/g.10450  ORF Transcript_6607/g.10450 Transcript_6607/m.10450 type:complete len:432 (-) Transcript_6607:75-1370(-)
MTTSTASNNFRQWAVAGILLVIFGLVAVQYHSSPAGAMMKHQQQAQQQLRRALSWQQPPPGLFSYCEHYSHRCQTLTGFLQQSKVISFTHISKCGGVSWIRELKRLAGIKVMPQGEAGPEYGLAYQNELVQEKFGITSEEDIYRLIAFRNPREHLYSQFRHCAYSDFGKGYSPVFPRSHEDSMVDFETWLTHYWNTASNDVVLEQAPYHCYHPVNMQTRALVLNHKNPAVMLELPKNFEHDLTQALQNYWQYDFVGLLEFYKESKCLLFYRILAEDYNNNAADLPDTIPAMKQYLQESCTCQAASADTPATNNNNNNALSDIHFDHSSQGAGAKSNSEFNVPFDTNIMDRLTRTDATIYNFALHQFLREMVWLEQKLGRRVLCDASLSKQESALSYLGIGSVTRQYQEYAEKARFESAQQQQSNNAGVVVA